jgi:hypothetical protein
MSVEQLIDLCRSRLAHLTQLRTSAVSLGDVRQVAEIDNKIDDTQATLNQLLTLV